MAADSWTLAVDMGGTSAVAAAGHRGQVRVLAPGPGDPLPPVTEAPMAAVLAGLLRAAAGPAGADQHSPVPGRLILIPPASWGDRELGVLTRAAATAGLPAPEFTAGPVATASYLAGAVPPGQAVAVLDVRGSSADAAVLRRAADGFMLAGTPGELISLAAAEPEVPLRRGSYAVLAAIMRAGLTPRQLAAAYIVGPPERAALAAGLLSRVLGVIPEVAAEPATTAVRGALAASPAGAAGSSGIAGRPAASSAAVRLRRGGQAILRTRRRKIAAGVAALAVVAAVASFATRVVEAAGLAVPRVFVISSRPYHPAQLTEINPVSRAIVRRLTVAAGANDLEFAPGQAHGYLLGLNQGRSGHITSFVTPFSAVTGGLGRAITVPGEIESVIFAPDGTTAYVLVTLQDNGELIPISTTTGARGRPVPVPGDNNVMAITPDGKTIYVTDQRSFTTGQDGLVTPVATATGSVGTPITVGLEPDGIAVTPDGRELYVVNVDSGTVTPIRTATGTAGPPIAVGLPGNVALTITMSPDGKAAYATSSPPGAAASSELTPVRTATNSAGPPLTVAGNFPQVLISPDSRTAYVLAQNTTPDGDGTVTPISLRSGGAGHPVVVGDPLSMIMSPDARDLYVLARPGENQDTTGVVIQVSTSTHAARQLISVPGSVVAVAAANVSP